MSDEQKGPDPVPKRSKLNTKQEQFCLEYLIDRNATQAAKRAGYSARTAGSQGFDLLQKPEIRAKIAQLIEERAEKTKIDAEYVLTQAVELHERCMTEEDFNAAGAAKALEIVGRHVEIQAFKDTVTVESELDYAGVLERAIARGEAAAKKDSESIH